MGGFFGAVSKRDVVLDVFFGVDYHSHLGTYRGGMAAWNQTDGFQRAIHSIENTPFRTRFEGEIREMSGTSCIGCISDRDPQPILISSHLGTYAIIVTGRINNLDTLVNEFLTSSGIHFGAQSGGRINATELVAALINQKNSFAEGIEYAQSRIDGTASILISAGEDGLYAARDRIGILPMLIGYDGEGYCVSFESFPYQKLGYEDVRGLGAGECVHITKEGIEVLNPPKSEGKFCAFLWTYYGYPNSRYEGDSVEVTRTRGGRVMARADKEAGVAQNIDSVCGVPDTGLPYAIGYANESGVPFSRPFIKYTPTWPRSFMPSNNDVRHRIAKMKMIPVRDLIKGKKLLFIDDSIVRGTQLSETVQFLYENGAEEVHMRSACPPVIYNCKYLNFSRNNSEMDLIARRTVQKLEGDEGQKHFDEYCDGKTERGRKMRCEICSKLGLTSLEFQSIEGVIESIGLPKDRICTYCWTGEE